MERLETQTGITEARATPMEWIGVETWRQCRYLSLKIDAFKSLSASIVKCPSQWLDFSRSPDPYRMMASNSETDKFNEHLFDRAALSSFERCAIVTLSCKLPEAIHRDADFSLANTTCGQGGGSNQLLRGRFQ